MSDRSATPVDAGSNLPKCPEWCTLGEHPFEAAETGFLTRVHRRVEFTTDPTLLVFEQEEFIFRATPLAGKGPTLLSMRALHRGRLLEPAEVRQFVADVIAACEKISGEKFRYGNAQSEG